MTHRAGAAPMLEGQPPARRRDGLLRYAAAVAGLVGVCCLLGASVALAAAPPVFSAVAGSPFATGDSPDAVAFSPSGGLLASANGGDNTLSMFSVSSTGALTEAPGSPDATGNSPDSVAFSPNGGLLAIANQGDDTVSIFSVSPTGALTPVGSPVATGSDPASVAFSPSGGLLATGNDNDDTVSMFSVSGAGGLSEIPGSPYPTGSDPVSIAFSPSGGLLVSANSGDSTTSVFSVSGAGALSEVSGSPDPTGDSPAGAAFSPDGGLLVTANQGDSTASVFSVSAGGALSEIPGSPYATGAGPDAVALSSGGLLAVANQTDSTLSVFSLESPTVLINSPGGSGSPTTTEGSITDCPRATGRLHGRTLGLVALGMTREQARRRYDHSSMRSSRWEDFFCLKPIGVHVGYASNELLKALPASERGKLRGRVVLALSANPFYALRGIHPGATLHKASTRLHLSAAMHVGAGDWYTIRNGSSTGVIDVQHGTVHDVGIANARLTGDRQAQLRFIKRFF